MSYYQKALINRGQIAVLANIKGITEPKFIQSRQKFIQNAFSNAVCYNINNQNFFFRPPPTAIPQEFSPTVFSRSPGKYGYTSNSQVLAVTFLFRVRLMGVFRNKQIDNQNIKYHES
ncbi:MAG: hypothetical protein JST50_16355 [Bacteroidetes bacterium]|nr:hypothetical protein [Bacteroidota bacterium]